MAWPRAGAAQAANGAKEVPSLTVSTQSKKTEVGIQTLIGDYIEVGSNHGKKYYQKVQKIEGHEDVRVYLYYWDKRDGEEFSGWWFGDQLGGSQVWSRSPSHTPTPPRVGWKIPWDAPKADLGALFVDPYKPGASPASSSPGPAKAGAAAGKVPSVRPPAAAGGGSAIYTEERMRKAKEAFDVAEAGASEALGEAKSVMTGDPTEDTLKQLQELLAKQKGDVSELPKLLVGEINDAKKGGPANNAHVSELAKMLPKARTLQANMLSELNKVQVQITKMQQAASAERKKAEQQEQRKAAEEKDAKELAESLPVVLEKVSSVEDAIEGLVVATEPLLANPPEADALKKAMDEVDTTATDAQNKLVEARKTVSMKLAAAKKYTGEVQKTATKEYTTLQTKLTEAQKKLNPFKTFRQSFKARVDARKALVDISDKMDSAELEAEKASLMTSAADQGQMSEDEVSTAEKLVAPATASISNVLRTLEAKSRTADAAQKQELMQMRDRGLAAKKKIDNVIQVLRQQRENIALQQVTVLAGERVETAEEALQKCGEAETPFLKGLEVLPAEESDKAIAACEAAAVKAEGVVNAAKLFCKNKLGEVMKKPKDSVTVIMDELKGFLERAEAASKKLQAFKTETLDRKTASKLSEVMDAINKAEAKVQILTEVCKVLHTDSLEEVTTEALQEALDKAAGAEKETTDACQEVRKAVAAKQKEAKGDLGVALQKLQGRLNAVVGEVSKQRKAAESGQKLIKGKTVIQEEETRIQQAEEEVEKVEKVIADAGEGGQLSDDAVREMGEAVVSSQKTLKTTNATLNGQMSGAVPALKASLQKLLDRSKKVQEKLNSVLASTKDQRERVLAQAYVKEGEKKAAEVEESQEKMNKAELPFLKGLEFLPVAEANETLKESEAAAAEVQTAITEARNYIAGKNLEVKQFKEDVSKPAVEDFTRLSDRVNQVATKLGQFKKDTEARWKTAKVQEVVEKMSAIETESKGLGESVAPFNSGEVEDLAVEEAYELCTKVMAQFKDLNAKMDEVRLLLAQRQKEKGGGASVTEQLQKLTTRLTEARTEVQKHKDPVAEKQGKVVSKKILLEANQLVERLDGEVKEAIEFCAPVADKGGDEFLVSNSLQTMATILRDHMSEKELSVEQLFKQIEGEAGGQIPRDSFVAYLEGLPTALGKEELTFVEDRRVAIAKQLDPDDKGAVSLEAFEKIFTTRFLCVKGISMTDGLEVATAKTITKVELEDVLEALGNPKTDEASGMSRVECKLVSSGKSGYVTKVGNGGTVYLETLSPFRSFVEKMDKKIADTVKSANEVANFFKDKLTELTSAGKQSAMAEARAELVKLRIQVTASVGSLEQLKKRAATAKADYPKKEKQDKEAYVEIREGKVATVILADVTAKSEAMDAGLKKLEENVAPLVSLKGAELEAFATPAAALKEADQLSSEVQKTVLEARAIREEHLPKVNKAVRGPFVDVKRELQKLELKAGTTQKKCLSVFESVRKACQTIVDSCFAPVATALRAEVLRRGVTCEAFFSEIVPSGEERISEEVFCAQLEKLEGLSVRPEHAALLCRHIEADGITKRKFLGFLQQYFSVIKGIAITDGFDVGTAKIHRQAEVDEILEVLEGPTLLEKLSIQRIRCRSLTDGVEGWVSVKGNQGSTFLNKVPKPFYSVIKEAPLDKEMKTEGEEAMRALKVDEVLELVEGPKKMTHPAGLRVRGKAHKDGAVGWFTVRDKRGVEFAQADQKYYTCTTSVAMTDTEDIKDCGVVRKLDKGETIMALAEPIVDDEQGITRINAKALKDEKTGWVTVKGNAGTVYCDAANKHFSVNREVPLEKSFASSSAAPVRMLEEGEGIQALETKEEVYPVDVRIKVRALADDAVGWISKAGTVKPWNPMYKCLEASPLHSSQSIEGAEVLRQLVVGETIELLDGPFLEGDDVRLKGRAEKDRVVGWASVRAAGKRLLSC